MSIFRQAILSLQTMSISEIGIFGDYLQRGMNRFSDRRIWPGDLALKSARIVDFGGKSRGLADFENILKTQL